MKRWAKKTFDLLAARVVRQRPQLRRTRLVPQIEAMEDRLVPAFYEVMG
jgi:hypothetical protein